MKENEESTKEIVEQDTVAPIVKDETDVKECECENCDCEKEPVVVSAEVDKTEVKEPKKKTPAPKKTIKPSTPPVKKNIPAKPAVEKKPLPVKRKPVNFSHMKPLTVAEDGNGKFFLIGKAEAYIRLVINVSAMPHSSKSELISEIKKQINCQLLIVDLSDDFNYLRVSIPYDDKNLKDVAAAADLVKKIFTGWDKNAAGYSKIIITPIIKVTSNSEMKPKDIDSNLGHGFFGFSDARFKYIKQFLKFFSLVDTRFEDGTRPYSTIFNEINENSGEAFLTIHKRGAIYEYAIDDFVRKSPKEVAPHYFFTKIEVNSDLDAGYRGKDNSFKIPKISFNVKGRGHCANRVHDLVPSREEDLKPLFYSLRTATKIPRGVSISE